MSGGSFQYAYGAIAWEAEDLAERLAADAAADWGAGAGLRDVCGAAVAQVVGQVSDMARAIEWFFSNDTGEDTLRRQAATWPAGVPGALADVAPPEACNRALLDFADQLDAKLADPEAIYVGGTSDDVPADLRESLEGVAGFCRAAAAALRQISRHLDGDTSAEELSGFVREWPPGLLAAASPETAPAPR